MQKPWFEKFTRHLTNKIYHKKNWGWCILLCTLGLLGGSYLVLLTPEITEPFTLAIFERIRPVFVWFTVFCAQTLVGLVLLRYSSIWSSLKPKNKIAYSIAIVFGALLVLWLLVAQTGLGITASDAGAGWNFLGAPLLEAQVFLAWFVGMLYIGLALWGKNHPNFLKKIRSFRSLRADLVISIVLWITAFAVWNSVPLVPNWFAAPPRPPNQAIYPNSDAYLYDTTGQSLLVGEGLKTQNAPFAIRPLYALYLAGLHAVGGVDYEPMIWMQVAVLALIPVILYWITRHLHNRVSALIAALLLIFRESNAIILGGSITTSHSKLLMADLPTTLGVMLLSLIFIRWLQKPIQRQTLTLIAGGVTGAFMLIRPEFGILLPFVGLAALFQLFKQPKLWFRGMILIAAGTVLLLIPWVWRNYQITGTIFLDSPHYRADLFALRYQEYEPDLTPTSQAPKNTPTPSSTQITPTPKIAKQPGESSEEFAERMAADAAQFAKENPGQVIHFILNHFFNSQVQSVLILPGTMRLADSSIGFLGHRDTNQFWAECCSAENYIRRLPFWFQWDGHLPQQTVIPLLINLFLLAAGLTIAWKQQKFIGLLPLAASVGYTLVNAFVRNSGGRYILPVDWVGILYFSIGLGQLSIWVIAYFRGAEIPKNVTGEIQPQLQDDAESPKWAANLGVAAVIFLFGCLLPLSEHIIPARYPQELLDSRFSELIQATDLDSFHSFVQTDGRVVQGRALYPRFHLANQGEAGVRRTPFSPLPFARVDFYLVGPFNGGVVLPQRSAPESLPNGADVFVIGCWNKKYFEAVAVAIYDEGGNLDQLLWSEPFPNEMSCPLNLADLTEAE